MSEVEGLQTDQENQHVVMEQSEPATHPEIPPVAQAEAAKDVAITHPMAGQGEDLTPNKDGGVMKAIIKASENTEMPRKGDHVEVHYVGTLLDGTMFDSSRDRGDRFSFTLGQGQVIKAWDIGIATMKIGEVCVLTCKPEYAYGKTAQRRIPANSTLVFEVELFSFQGDDLTINKDKGILRRIVQAGEGVDTPNEDANVDVHLTGIYEDRIFEDRDVQFVIGEAIDQGIPSGVEEAIQKMKKGEKIDLDLSSKYAFGSVGKAEFSIPPNVNVRYQVDLKDFEKAKESWEMDLDEKMKSSEVIKAKGTEYFKSGNYLKAIKQYKKIVDYLSSERETEMPPETQKECDKLVLAANLNLAMCYLKIGEEVQAVDVCDKALQIDNKNEKGYFRRGSARLIQNELQLAAEDFQTVLELEPNNKAAKNQLILVCKKMKLQKEQERKTYGNMFTRFAEQDAKAEAKKKTEIIKKPDTKPDETENVNEDLEMEDESPETNENTV